MIKPAREFIPHFRRNGGIWHVVKNINGRCYSGNQLAPHKRFEAWLSESQFKDLISAYFWWKGKAPVDAHISDSMIMRRASAMRFLEPYPAKKITLCLDGRGSNVFADNPTSVFSDEFFSTLRFKGEKKNPAKQNPKMIQRMIASGYCRVSNNHQTVSRLDKTDWQKEVALYYNPDDPDGAGRERAVGCTAADTYRRCIGKDKVHIENRELFKLFPSSDSGPWTYLPMVE